MKKQAIQLIFLLSLLSTNTWAGILPPEKEQKLLELEARVAGLEQKASELKRKINAISRKIFKKKFTTRKPQMTIHHTNEMAGYLRIVQLNYFLLINGKKKQLLTKKTTVRKKMPDKFHVYTGEVAAGRHTLLVEAKIRGYNPILTYINNYKIELSNRYIIPMQQGRRTKVEVLFKDNGAKDFNKRLSIVFRVTQ